METVFEDRSLTRIEAVKKIMEETGVKKSAAYNALNDFKQRLLNINGRLTWT